MITCYSYGYKVRENGGGGILHNLLRGGIFDEVSFMMSEGEEVVIMESQAVRIANAKDPSSFINCQRPEGK